MKEKTIPYFEIKDISEITLLSTEEWEKVKEIKSVPKYTSWWWLRSPGTFSYYAVVINSDSDFADYGYYVHNRYVCVRPSFRVPNFKSKIGSKIFIENTLCTVIDTDYVLSDIVICRHKFDKESNDYDKSEIKQFINSDEFKKML